MVKRLLLCLLLMLPLLCAAALADVQVIDNANVIDADTEVRIIQRIDAIEAKHQIDLVVLTTTDTPADSTYEMYYVSRYADDFYDNGGYGMGADDSGMLILLDMHNRVMWLSTGGVMIEYINDAREERILDEAYYYLQYGRYGEAIEEAVRMTGSYLDRGREEGSFLYDETTGQRLSVMHNALTRGEMVLAGVVGVAAAVVLVSSVSGSYSLKGSTYRYDLNENCKFELTRNDERFLHRNVRTVVRHQSSGPSTGGGMRMGGGGGSGVHRSSGGVRHGGGGRRF